jgi:hypothetical protein
LALFEQGKQVTGEDGRRLLVQATEAYQQTLEVYARESQPEHHARVRTHLGEALRELGRLTEGEAGQRFLAASVEAWRQALKLYTAEKLAEEQAHVQRELDATLKLQAGAPALASPSPE